MMSEGSQSTTTATINTVLDRMEQMFTMMRSERDCAEKRHKEITDKFDAMDRRINTVEHQLSGYDKNNLAISDEVKELKQTINYMKQEKMLTDIIVQGVPEVESNQSELLAIVQQIVEKLNGDQPLSVCSVRRIGKLEDEHGSGSEKKRSIIVKFKTPDEKFIALNMKKKLKISCDQLTLNGQVLGKSTDILFFDERLTKANAELYYAARMLRKRKMIEYVWIHHGAVFVKKDDNTERIRVTDTQQLRIFEKRKQDQSPNTDNSSDSVIVLSPTRNTVTEQVDNKKRRRKKHKVDMANASKPNTRSAGAADAAN